GQQARRRARDARLPAAPRAAVLLRRHELLGDEREARRAGQVAREPGGSRAGQLSSTRQDELDNQPTKSADGIGFAMWKPCAWSQPKLDSRSSVHWSSTCSATAVRPRLWASSAVERTIAVSSAASPRIPRTNDPSILSSWTGSRRSRLSDVYPMPKSSI